MQHTELDSTKSKLDDWYNIIRFRDMSEPVSTHDELHLSGKQGPLLSCVQFSQLTCQMSARSTLVNLSMFALLICYQTTMPAGELNGYTR